MSRIACTAFGVIVGLLSGPAASAPNKPPTVSLTAPAGGATYAEPATITLTAVAADAKGTVAKVDFYHGGSTLIGTATLAPYSLTWPNVPAGSYVLTARATDSDGATSVSSPVGITVTAPSNEPPSVSLTMPAGGAYYTAPATIEMGASAADADGSVAKVEFFSGPTLLGTVTRAPYSFAWPGVGPGSYTLSARATDNRGGTAKSDARMVTVGRANVPPLVAMTSPSACGPIDVASGVTLTADAFDPDGHVTVVEFYEGDTLIGTVGNTSPYADRRNGYSMAWNGMPPRTYVLTAKAYDNKGASTLSAPAEVALVRSNRPPVVTMEAPPSGATYPAGAPITVTAAASDPDGTIVSVEFFAGATPIANRVAAPYSITWTPDQSGSYTLSAAATDDQGASARSSAVIVTIMPNDPPTVTLSAPENGASAVVNKALSLSATATDSDGSVSKVEFYAGQTLVGTATSAPYTVSWTPTQAGTWPLSARATDNLGASSVSAAISVSVSAGPPPTVRLTSPETGATYSSSASIVVAAVAAAASDAASIARIDFYEGSSLIGTATAPPFVAAWSPGHAGSYQVVAVATDTLGVPGVSAPVSVVVVDSPPPSVSLTSPAAGSDHAAPARLVLSANATASAGTRIAQVEFFEGNTLIGAVTGAPYTYAWAGVAAGSYSITARARDSLGAQSACVPVSVVVRDVSIAVTSPQDGAALTGIETLVRGTFQGPVDSGVVVNGVVAAVDTGNNFYARVPLRAGMNEIRAMLTARTGHTSTRSITVMSDGAPPFLAVAADRTDGIAPLKARFTLANNGPAEASVRVNGGSPFSLAARASAELAFDLDTAQIVPVRIEAADTLGNTATHEFVVVASDAAQVDRRFRSLWNGMNGALLIGDKTGALGFLNAAAQTRYGPVFDALMADYANIVATWSEPVRGQISDDFGEYGVVTADGGVHRLFLIYFVRGADGVWRMDTM